MCGDGEEFFCSGAKLLPAAGYWLLAAGCVLGLESSIEVMTVDRVTVNRA
jgi:hypothetical protein